jgi:hypothetical protein
VHALSRFFARHGITVKKSLRAAERKRADVARARRRWIREQGLLDPAPLLFIDEGSHHQYAATQWLEPTWRALGQRCPDGAPAP